ncbi:hypothetical protein [Neoaquamicrobium sediminum]|uniref:hypothetical protein n=1 Tax=Neoaquamicrobium sediminum TaxID=1849104 RepID=UPI0015646400|nr:hypothetical protein [Mesorhizobium sediminum]NRC52542.1 hypothetical protein [Mesorhizobium sediminum]
MVEAGRDIVDSRAIEMADAGNAQCSILAHMLERRTVPDVVDQFCTTPFARLVPEPSLGMTDVIDKCLQIVGVKQYPSKCAINEKTGLGCRRGRGFGKRCTELPG